MKKRLTRLFGCLLTLALSATPALAEMSYSGQIAPGEVLQIQAPFSAAVEQIDAEAGDFIHSGDALFQLSVSRIYAPCDGTVQGVLAQEGDRLEDNALFYSGALYIEPQIKYLIHATTDSTAGEKENKILHVGETVYLRRNSDSDRRTGTGRITAVSGSAFTVEVLSGDVILDDSCYIYRSDSYDYDTRVGRGTVERSAPIAVSGSGTVLKMYVQDGQTVRKGDLLMETAAGAKPGDDAQITAPADGILASSTLTLGGSVGQNQPVMEIWPQGSFVIEVNADEYDLPKFEIGQCYIAILDCMPAKTCEATVTEIGYCPTQENGKTSYTVTLSFENDDFVRPGMSVTLTSKE